jgi:hypothetical protein
VRQPALVVQGGLDPFGAPGAIPALPDAMGLVDLPGTNHMFAPAGPSTFRNSIALVTAAVAEWCDALTAFRPYDRRRRPSTSLDRGSGVVDTRPRAGEPLCSQFDPGVSQK